MKEKDYNSIYEKLFEKYLEKYINEIESLFKHSKKEGDTENFAYNSCISTLTKKRNGLKILIHPYDKLYSIFNDRGSLVQENNLNRLYIKHIIPLCEELNIEIKDGVFENILEEFVIAEASSRVYSWFSNWATVYKMMFDLDDFSEFKIFRNCNFHEGSEIFIKYHKKKHPRYYLNINDKKGNDFADVDESKQSEHKGNSVKNFNLIEDYKKDFKIMYEDFTEYYIDEKKTTKEDYENVLFENFNEHKSFITFSCSPQEAALILFKLMGFFTDLTYTNIGNSKVFKNKSGKIITSTNYGQRVAPFNPKSGNLNLSAKQNTMLTRAENFIQLIKEDTFKY